MARPRRTAIPRRTQATTASNSLWAGRLRTGTRARPALWGTVAPPPVPTTSTAPVATSGPDQASSSPSESDFSSESGSTSATSGTVSRILSLRSFQEQTGGDPPSGGDSPSGGDPPSGGDAVPAAGSIVTQSMAQEYIVANPNATLPEILFGAVEREIQIGVTRHLNLDDIQQLRAVNRNLNRSCLIDEIFRNAGAADKRLGGACEVLVEDKTRKPTLGEGVAAKECGNGPHNGRITRYCRMHGTLLNICRRHTYREDRSDEIEAMWIHGVCSHCQGESRLDPGDSNCTCEDTLRNWCCKVCARKKILDWKQYSDQIVRGLEDKKAKGYRLQCPWNPKRLCRVCHERMYKGLHKVNGVVVPQVRWCPSCEDLGRDAHADYEFDGEEEEEEEE